jgi:uncharacterized protein (DUF1697 family)
MATYLSILRGINVSGQKMIKMADLKALYETLGFKNITTYIQSGNVVFESKTKKNLAALIEQKIKNTFGFDVPVIVLTQREMQAIVEQNPFLKEKNIELDRLYVTFLAETPLAENLTKIATYDYSPEVFVIKEKAAYLYCPKGYGNTKLSNSFFENKLKVKATTRNWNTTNKLFEILISNSNS